MLNNDDRNAIEGLFERLSDVERKSAPRDRDAERLIADKIERQPSAPYYMAQTILVQEQALEEAARRINELENERRQPVQRSPWDRGEDRHGDRYDRYADDRRGGLGGGGFLAGAAQTALGVTSGILIGNMIASMFGGGEAHAAEAPQDQQTDQSGQDNAVDNNDTDAGNDDFGGDAFGGGDGGFDFGGDF